MAIIQAPFFLGGATGSGYTIENSIMLDGGADYLVRDPFTAGDRKTFTFSCWLKRSAISGQGGTTGNNIFGGDRTSTFSDRIMFGSADDGNDQLETSYHDGSSGLVKTSALYRDPTAWMNIVWVVDTTQSTDTNRVKVYVNGSLVTFNSPSYPAEDYLTAINNTENQVIGARPGNVAQQHFGGYMAEVILLDGTAESDASKFGKLDSNGVWVPVEPSGLTFGTNGYHLKFDSSSLLGKSSNSTTNPTSSFLGSNVQSGAASTHTVSDATLGAAASNRSIVIAAGGARSNAGDRTATCTVGGAAATEIVRSFSGKPNCLYFFIIDVPTGTEADIVVSYSGGNNNMDASGIAWWRVLDAGQPISINTANADGWSSINTSTIGQTNDVALYALFDSGSITGFNWSDATERADHPNITGGSSTLYGFTAADYTFDSAESHTETVSAASGTGNETSYAAITLSNNNSFETNSITAANQVEDTCTDSADDDIGNYCTWNPVCAFPSAKVTLSDGNTQATITPDGAIIATQFFDITDSDGFYWETKFTSNVSNAEHVGIGQQTVPLNNTNYLNNGIATYLSDGGADHTSSARYSGGTFPTYTDGDTISVAVKGGAIWFAKNGSWINSATASEIAAGTTTNAVFTSMTGMWTSMVRGHSGSACVSTTNWGASAFTYTPPTGLKRLMTADRSAPTVKDPDDGFALITLEDGNTIEASLATARSGWGSFIDVFFRETDGQDKEVRFSDDSGNSMHFNTNTAAGSEQTLSSGVNYSAFSWRVGTAYGCYTAEISHTSGATTNQAHGLGSGAKSAVAKRSDSTGDWYVSHPNMSSANIRFNVQEATTSELVTVDGTNVTLNSSFATGTYRVIVWEQIEGFSAFTGYDHNGSTTDGPYIDLGGSASLIAWRNIDSSNYNDFFSTFPSYTSNGNGNPTDVRYNWGNQEKGYTGITIGDVTANGYKMRPSSGGAFGKDAGDPMLVWAWGLRPFGGSGVAQGRAR